MYRSFIAFLKISVFLLSIPLCVLIHLVTRAIYKQTYIPRMFSAFCCRLFGLKIRAVLNGERLDGIGDQRLSALNEAQSIYLSNHISYLDIIVLGAFLEGSFVAKSDVKKWPIFGLLAKLQGTVFITRSKRGIKDAYRDLNEALADGKSVIFFPEGTSTDGRMVAPFKSAVLPVFIDHVRANEHVNLVLSSIVIKDIDGERPYQQNRLEDEYAWHGDMILVPHLWAVAKRKQITVEVSLCDNTSEKLLNEKMGRKEFSVLAHAMIASMPRKMQKLSKHPE